MRFKVGDKVIIRDDLNECFYDDLFCTNEMADLGDEVLTIKSVNENPESYSVEENDFRWNDYMIDVTNTRYNFGMLQQIDEFKLSKYIKGSRGKIRNILFRRKMKHKLNVDRKKHFEK
jgi:hypothetical protein